MHVGVCKQRGYLRKEGGGRTDRDHDSHGMAFMRYLLTFSFWDMGHQRD